MRATLIALVCFVAVVLSAPARPVIPNAYDSHVIIEVREVKTHQSHFGEGFVGLDRTAGKGIEFVKFQHERRHDIYRLQRYDLGFDYEIVNVTQCTERKVEGSMPDEWAWVANATYGGQHQYKEHTVDIWEIKFGYATLRLGVNSNSPNTPHYLSRQAPDREMFIDFLDFKAQTPQASWFEVPRICKSSEDLYFEKLLGCVSRSTITSRAQSWVNAHVPYNQGATHDGYREDCSGFVSMAWESSKPGHTTSTMHEIAHPISRGQLQPGDVLLCASEHVVLFGGWVDGSHYMAYEETRPGEGTVKRSTPYPYWYNTGCFLPYRYNSVC